MLRALKSMGPFTPYIRMRRVRHTRNISGIITYPHRRGIRFVFDLASSLSLPPLPSPSSRLPLLPSPLSPPPPPPPSLSPLPPSLSPSLPLPLPSLTRIAQSEHNLSPYCNSRRGGKLEWNISVTSKEFDAILNISEGLHSSINTTASPK